MSHLIQLQKAFGQLRLANYFAEEALKSWRVEAQAEIDRQMKQAEVAGQPKAGYVYYAGLMADGFDGGGNLVKSVLLHQRGDGDFICQTLRANGLHPSYPGGKNVIELSPYLELEGRILESPHHVLSQKREEGVFLFGRDDEKDSWYLQIKHSWLNPPSVEYRDPGTQMVVIMAQEDYPELLFWLAHFTEE